MHTLPPILNNAQSTIICTESIDTSPIFVRSKPGLAFYVTLKHATRNVTCFACYGIHKAL
ncbi:hypothetical protein SAMN05421724_1087 [Pseudomonas syringae]|nr:hypothetical protein SAMN05421724_1087 [Pseudomonas syringae]